MTDVERVCVTCLHADAGDCVRDGRHRQSYETRYDDSDFCGPDRRYWVPKRTTGQWVADWLTERAAK